MRTKEQKLAHAAYMRLYYKNNPNKKKQSREKYKERHKNNQLKIKYNISLSEYNAMLDSQNGLCKICLNPEKTKISRGNGIRSLAVDHDHVTGKVRGLLCNTCNVTLGKYEKWKQNFSAIEEYLKQEDK